MSNSEDRNRTINRAGIIPWMEMGDGEPAKMLFMRPSNPKYGGPEFQIAKGRVDDGEDILSAALREGEEELGLLKQNIYLLTNLGVRLGRTQFFLVKIKNKDYFREYKDETAETRWMTCSEFVQIGRPLHRQVVEEAQELIDDIIAYKAPS